MKTLIKTGGGVQVVEVKNIPLDRLGVSSFHHVPIGGILMSVLTMRQAAKALGVTHQTLSYYFVKGKVSGQNIGTTVLVDPEQAQKELEALGHYRRAELRRSRKRAEAEK